MDNAKTNHRLTGEEQHVLQLLANGNESEEICDEMKIDDETLQVHLKNLFKKFRVKNINEAVVAGVHENLITCLFIQKED